MQSLMIENCGRTPVLPAVRPPGVLLKGWCADYANAWHMMQTLGDDGRLYHTGHACMSLLWLNQFLLCHGTLRACSTFWCLRMMASMWLGSRLRSLVGALLLWLVRAAIITEGLAAITAILAHNLLP